MKRAHHFCLTNVCPLPIIMGPATIICLDLFALFLPWRRFIYVQKLSTTRSFILLTNHWQESETACAILLLGLIKLSCSVQWRWGTSWTHLRPTWISVNSVSRVDTKSRWFVSCTELQYKHTPVYKCIYYYYKWFYYTFRYFPFLASNHLTRLA